MRPNTYEDELLVEFMSKHTAQSPQTIKNAIKLNKAYRELSESEQLDKLESCRNLLCFDKRRINDRCKLTSVNKDTGMVKVSSRAPMHISNFNSQFQIIEIDAHEV